MLYVKNRLQLFLMKETGCSPLSSVLKLRKNQFNLNKKFRLEHFMKEITSLRTHEIIMESLILAQNERWRRVLSMQVGRQDLCLHKSWSGGLVSNAWVTYPYDWDSR